MTRADSEAGAGAVAPADGQGRVLTVPNAISVARLAGVPVFLWLVLGPHADGWAVALLIVAALSDWLDGVIARAWNQESRLGQVLDPAADRLYIAATLIGLAIRTIIPWWLVALLVARELVPNDECGKRHGHEQGRRYTLVGHISNDKTQMVGIEQEVVIEVAAYLKRRDYDGKHINLGHRRESWEFLWEQAHLNFARQAQQFLACQHTAQSHQ